MRSTLVVAMLALTARTASAERIAREAMADDVAAAPAAEATGMFLPLTIGARVDPDARIGRLETGYDLAHGQPVMEASGEATVLGPLAVRLGAVSGEHGGLRPSFGIRVQALSQDRLGIDGALAIAYKPEGFTELEGEVEATLAVARRFGQLQTFANLVYGQDPDGRERDGEARTAVVIAATPRLSFGVDARVRVDLSAAPAAANQPSVDLVAGPLVAYAFDHVVVLAKPGVSAFRTAALHGGPIVLASVGFAY